MKEAYRDSADAYLSESMTGIASSAPRENFIMNIDLVDTVINSEVELTTFISVDNQNTWNSYPGYSLNNSIGYNNINRYILYEKCKVFTDERWR